MSFTSTGSTGAVLYHCPCGTPAASTSYRKLPTLYFCTECDCIHCSDCVLEDVSSYYCPNCLFEVPSASVRAEKNRCARNCFLCPCCSNTLAVVPTDSTDPAVMENSLSPHASVGEPPYFLSCLACHWDSKVASITFDKPTGLAAQLQKLDENTPASAHYENIREHLEPWLKAGLTAEQAAATAGRKSSHHTSSHRPTHAIAAAARALSHSNTTISRDIPSSIASASRFNSLHNIAAIHRSSALRSGSSKSELNAALTQRDELVNYKPKANMKMTPAEVEAARAKAVKSIASLEEMAKVEQRWCTSSNQALTMADLHPLRIPLRSKRNKRCPTCRHILCKPDTKAGSTKFKMRLMAINYLPQIEIHRRIPPSLGSRLSAVGSTNSTSASASRRGRVSTSGPTSSASAVETLVAIGSPQDLAEPLRPGRNFSYQLTFTNPLYEAVDVLVEVAEPEEEEAYPVEDGDVLEPSQETTSQTREDSQPVHWNVSMPNPSFGINACAEEWEYDEDDDEDEAALSSGTASARIRKHGPGILAKRGNKTAIQLDLSVGREATGDIRVPLYITYTYTAEEPLVPPLSDKTDKRKVTNGELKAQASAQESVTSAAPPEKDRPDIDKTPTNLKSFSFWTSVPLGRVVPRATGSTLNVEHSEARRVPSSSNLH